MFTSILKEKNEKYWLIFHVLFGIVCVYTNIPLMCWYWLVVITSLISLFKAGNHALTVIYILTYTIGIEQLNRSVNATPVVPDEIGKYLPIALFLISLALPGKNKNKRVRIGEYMLLLSLPAFLVLPSNFLFRDIVFNYFGFFNLCIGVIYFSKQKISYSELKNIFKIILFPILSFAVYLIVKQGQAEKVVYRLSANYLTSGGSAANQVATVLGFASVVLIVAYLTNQKIFKIKYVDKILLGLFFFRGLLTFSRGGMISVLLTILLILIIPKSNNKISYNQITFRKIKPKYYLFGAIFLVAIFLVVNSITNNNLLLRYKGYTNITINTGERDLSTITSGRLDIFNSDISTFLRKPLLGCGVGQSKYERIDAPFYGNPGWLPHIEVSRILAEHGIFGIFIVLIMLIYPLYKILTTQDNYQKIYMTAFFTVAIASSFHSATRTMVTPLLYGMAFIHLIPDSLYNNDRNKFNTGQIQTIREQYPTA